MPKIPFRSDNLVPVNPDKLFQFSLRRTGKLTAKQVMEMAVYATACTKESFNFEDALELLRAPISRGIVPYPPTAAMDPDWLLNVYYSEKLQDYFTELAIRGLATGPRYDTTEPRELTEKGLKEICARVLGTLLGTRPGYLLLHMRAPIPQVLYTDETDQPPRHETRTRKRKA